MSLIYITRCDSCKTQEREWPDSNYGSLPNWAAVQVEGSRFDYCPECWERVQKALELGKKVGLKDSIVHSIFASQETVADKK